MTRCSFDGQDSILGADYVFTNHTNFLMVEFKYEEPNLKSEKLKPRRLKLCRLLDDNDDWRDLSSQCHYVAWSEEIQAAPKGRRFVILNGYYNEICNRRIFGEQSALKRKAQRGNLRVRAGRLVDEFLAGDLGVDFHTFQQYTDWLMSLEDREPSGIELMIDDNVEDELILMDFHSIQDLKGWLDTTTLQPPQPRNSSGPRMG